MIAVGLGSNTAFAQARGMPFPWACGGFTMPISYDSRAGTSALTARTSMRILIVEDEPELLSILAQALREEGYAVDTAADGEEGIFRAESWDYDAIVLDLMLPKINGMQLLERLRREKKTPVLILTARDTVNDRVRGLDGGADDYLVKPFELSELFARLRALIRRSNGQAVPTINLGTVSLDIRARRATQHGEEVSLTAREYALVEMLAMRRGQVVSRSEMYEHLFDENEDTMSNLLDVHVSNIRRKLGKDFITTRRGHGYSIDD
jgi:two-component system OmpR family response regulator